MIGWILALPWLRRFGAWLAALAVISLGLLSFRKSSERVGRLQERVESTEKANDIQRQMLDAAARRPRDRDELADRMRDGRF